MVAFNKVLNKLVIKANWLSSNWVPHTDIRNVISLFNYEINNHLFNHVICQNKFVQQIGCL